jgi:hypothetical protein
MPMASNHTELSRRKKYYSQVKKPSLIHFENVFEGIILGDLLLSKTVISIEAASVCSQNDQS